MNDQFLCCRLCSTAYDQAIHLPRLLNDCGHTVCEKCIKQQEGHFRCPADETLYEYSIEGFPINTTLFKLIQLKEKSKVFETPQITLTSPQSFSESCQFVESQIIAANVSSSFTDAVAKKEELIQKIERKFNEVVTRLEIRKTELLNQLELKFQQFEGANLEIDFPLQMDVLIPRFGTLRETLYFDNQDQGRQFPTFSNRNRQRSTSRKIFEEPETIQIRPLLAQQKQNELRKIIRQLARSENIDVIQLKNKDITDDDLKTFSAALSTSISFVREINFCKNKISDEGFISVIDALWTNKTVKILKFKHNKITEPSINYLSEIYEDQKYNSLQQIHLQGNPLKCDEQIANLTRLGLIIYK